MAHLMLLPTKKYCILYLEQVMGYCLNTKTMEGVLSTPFFLYIMVGYELACPILDKTSVDFQMASKHPCSKFELSALVSQFNTCAFCDLQHVKDKSKPVVPSKDSKELDKLCKRFLIPKKYTILLYLLIKF